MWHGGDTRTFESQDLSAGEIADHFNISKPSISHHLDILKRADLITFEKTAIHHIPLTRR
jgi:DNA-binding transcriptional ArsR family regulator